MGRITLDPEDKKRLEELEPDLEEIEKALSALREAGMPAPGLEEEVAKIKRAREILLQHFTE